MAPTHDDYERIGRFLDGEPLTLTPEQKLLADEILQAERALGTKLDAAPPAGSLHRIGARVRTELPAPRPARRWARWLPAAAAAAAGVALALFWQPPAAQHARTLGEAEYVQAFLDVPETGLDAEVRVLSDELAEYHVDLTVGEPVPLKIAVDGLDQELGDTGDKADPDMWELLEEPL